MTANTDPLRCRSRSTHPARGWFPEPVEMAAAVAFLASDEAGYIYRI
jgi:NAD(P)-dependent dehydrogenase (short-subunit alcohol dehydrogenase family)